MKKTKIKWGNVVKAIIFLFCIGLILHDFYMLTIHSFVTGNLYGWTWYGFITFWIAVMIASLIYEDFEEQIENIPSYQPKHARDIDK